MDLELPIFCIQPRLMNEEQCVKEINRLIKRSNNTFYTKKDDERLDECFDRLKQISDE